jgi:hypothetical protein
VRRFFLLVTLATAALLQPWQASAQTWSPQQQEVWTVVQAQWQAGMAKDAGWMERFLQLHRYAGEGEQPVAVPRLERGDTPCGPVRLTGELLRTTSPEP